jgi:Domain of unknown function (DUF4190)
MSDAPSDENPQSPTPAGPTPGPYPGGSVPPIPHVPPNDVYAVWSIVLGLLGIFCCGLLAAIPAIVLAVQSKKRIAASNGEMKGDGMAQAGFIMGIVGVALQVIALLVALLVFLFGT